MRVQVVWVVRHGEIGDAFFDLDAAQFLLAAAREYRAALQRPEALGTLPDRCAVRFNFACACVLAAGAAEECPGVLQARGP